VTAPESSTGSDSDVEDEEEPTFDATPDPDSLAEKLNRQYEGFIKAKVAFHNRHGGPAIAHYQSFGMPPGSDTFSAPIPNLAGTIHHTILYVVIGPQLLSQAGAFELLATLLDKTFFVEENAAKQSCLLYLCFAPSLSDDSILDFFREGRLLPKQYQLFKPYKAVIVLVSAFNRNLCAPLRPLLGNEKFQQWFNEQAFWLEVETVYLGRQDSVGLSMNDYVNAIKPFLEGSLLKGYDRILRFEERQTSRPQGTDVHQDQYRNCLSFDELLQCINHETGSLKNIVKPGLGFQLQSHPLVYIQGKETIDTIAQYTGVIEAHGLAFQSWRGQQVFCYEGLEKVRHEASQGRVSLTAELSRCYRALANDYVAAFQTAITEHTRAVRESRYKFVPSLGKKEGSFLGDVAKLRVTSALAPALGAAPLAVSAAFTAALPYVYITGATAWYAAYITMNGLAFPILLTLLALTLSVVGIIDYVTKPKLEAHAFKLNFFPVDSREISTSEFKEIIGGLAYHLYNKVPEDLQSNDNAFIRLVFTNIKELDKYPFWFGEVMRILREAIAPPKASFGAPVAQNRGGNEGFFGAAYNTLKGHQLKAVHSAFRICIPYAWLAYLIRLPIQQNPFHSMTPGAAAMGSDFETVCPDFKTVSRFLQSLPMGVHIEFEVIGMLPINRNHFPFDVNQKIRNEILRLIEYIATGSVVSFTLPGFMDDIVKQQREASYNFTLQEQKAGLVPAYRVNRAEQTQSKALVELWRKVAPDLPLQGSSFISLPSVRASISRLRKLAREATALKEEKIQALEKVEKTALLGFNPHKKSTFNPQELSLLFFHKPHLLALPEPKNLEESGFGQ
jgi:hypothetical protein